MTIVIIIITQKKAIEITEWAEINATAKCTYEWELFSIWKLCENQQICIPIINLYLVVAYNNIYYFYFILFAACLLFGFGYALTRSRTLLVSCLWCKYMHAMVVMFIFMK